MQQAHKKEASRTAEQACAPTATHRCASRRSSRGSRHAARANRGTGAARSCERRATYVCKRLCVSYMRDQCEGAGCADKSSRRAPHTHRIAGIRCHLEHCVALTPVFIVVTVCMALVISLADVFNPLAAPRIRRRAAVRPLWQHHAVEGAQVTRRVRSRRVEVLVGRQAAGGGQGKGRWEKGPPQLSGGSAASPATRGATDGGMEFVCT